MCFWAAKEIGRNCCRTMVDDRILLVDCGIMFLDAFHYAWSIWSCPTSRTRARSGSAGRGDLVASHAHEATTPAVSCSYFRDVSVPVYGLRASRRPQPHRASGHADRPSYSSEDGERRRSVRSTASSSRSRTCSPRIRDRALHARRHDRAQRRLSAIHAGRRAPLDQICSVISPAVRAASARSCPRDSIECRASGLLRRRSRRSVLLTIVFREYPDAVADYY